MEPTVLDWQGGGTFRCLLCDRQAWTRFDGPGVYMWTETMNGRETPVYIGRASHSPSLMQRLTRHYLGSIGALYYLEPKLTSRKRSEKAISTFQTAAEVLSKKDLFLSRVDKAFDEMERYKVYLVRCDTDVARAAEADLIKRWPTDKNTRKEKPGRRSDLIFIHSGQLPAELW